MREGTVIAGKYRLERSLARGGMGAVWVARHLQLDEQVAVKFMDISLPAVADARARFEREARAAARIRSPHVVQILDYGVDGEMPYIVMELLEGEHLGTRLKREGRLSLTAAAVIAEQVAKALQRAHRNGIIHRDLKPANVFLASVDDDEIVKILDFGIVKSMAGGGLAGESTKSDVLMGSPNYMSPEQARGARSVDHRTDLWSLGVVLFRAITGKMAFSGDSVVDVILKICTGPIPVPSAVAPDLPPEIDPFFARALERDPARRFSSAREMGAELTAIVKALGPRADVVGPRPASSIEPPDMPQSSILDGDIVVSSTPPSADGTPRWRQLLQGSVEQPTVPHARTRPKDAPAHPPSSSSPPTVRERQPEFSAPLAALLKQPPEPPVNTSLATLLRPQGASPATGGSVHKPASPSGRTGTTPVPPAFKAPHHARPVVPPPPPSSKSGIGLLSLLQAPEEAPPEKRDPDREPSAFIRLTTPNQSGQVPQSDRSAEIAQFIDQAFLALQASDPMPGDSRRDPTSEKAPSSPAGLLKLRPPSWPTSQPAPGLAALLSKSSSNPVSSRNFEAPPAQPPADETSVIEPAMSERDAERIKHRAAHAGRFAKLVDEGFSALRRGDREHARACWTEALTIDPTDRMLRLNLRKLEMKAPR